MPVLYIYESPQASIDLYDRVSSELLAKGPPEGQLYHVACKREGGGLLITEVWESEGAHDRFEPIRAQKIAQEGGPQRPAPRKLEIHNMVSRERARV